MNIHYIKHVSFEGLGSMESIFLQQECALSYTHMYEDPSLPFVREIDALIVMGGPMGVADDDKFPWLSAEKKFIEAAIKRDIPVLGVCLGAQLIANVLGAEVSSNHCEEIGWYPVKRTQDTEDTRVNSFPSQFYVYHWHSDTFEIPAGASNFLASEGCAHQGFIYGQNTLGLQFHLEMMPSNVQAIYQECGLPEKQGEYVQGLDEMLASAEYFHHAQKITETLAEGFIFQKVPQLTLGDK